MIAFSSEWQELFAQRELFDREEFDPPAPEEREIELMACLLRETRTAEDWREAEWPVPERLKPKTKGTR